MGMPRVEWSSKYSGYLMRASRHPNPHSYTPQRNLLTLVAFRNAKGDPESFSLAVFPDRVAIAANGQVYVLDQEDYDGMMELAQAVAGLPKAEDYRNQWRGRQERTCYPNRLHPLRCISVSHVPLCRSCEQRREKAQRNRGLWV